MGSITERVPSETRGTLNYFVHVGIGLPSAIGINLTLNVHHFAGAGARFFVRAVPSALSLVSKATPVEKRRPGSDKRAPRKKETSCTFGRRNRRTKPRRSPHASRHNTEKSRLNTQRSCIKKKGGRNTRGSQPLRCQHQRREKREFNARTPNVSDGRSETGTIDRRWL